MIPAEGDTVLRLEGLVTQMLQLIDGGHVSMGSLQGWALAARGRYDAGDLQRAVCASPECGRQIVWGITRDGKRIPLDPRPQVYALMDRGYPGGVLIARARFGLVTHFATCPAANSFSKKKGAPA